MLASRTIEIKEEFFKYVQEGKLFESTALLLLAHNILAPCCEGGSKIREFVSEEIAALKIFIFRSSYELENDKLIYEAKKKKTEMEAIMLVLEIFNRVGNKIVAYLEQQDYYNVAKEINRVGEVSWLLKEAGFDAELDLLDEILRDETNIFRIIDTSKNNEDRETNIRLTDNDLGGPDGNNKSHCRTYHTRINTKQSSKHWLANKQDMIDMMNLNAGLSNSFTYHFARGCRDFGSTTVTKDVPFCRTYQSVCVKPGLGSTTTDKVDRLVPKFQLKELCEGFDKSSVRRTNKVCSWASNLQFNQEYVLSTNSLSWIRWITNKLGRAL